MSQSEPPDSNTDPEPEPGFEQALGELEQIVARLESGEQTLEQDLADFERGIALARQCEGRLSTAEQEVRRLVGEGSTESLSSLDPEGEDGAAAKEDE